MKKSEFYFELPTDLIAQTPLKNRADSKLLHLDKTTGKIEHKNFSNILDLLKKDDLLILNNSRVIPARIFGTKVGSQKEFEFLLLKNIKENCWETLVKPGKKAKVGDQFSFGKSIINGEIKAKLDSGNRILEFDPKENFLRLLDEIGEMPLPPYITKKLEDAERYQTIYSKEVGSVAAPTAGLHFTQKIIKQLEEKGVKIGYITLHVGVGTFRPVKSELIEDHDMHTEYFSIPKETTELILKAKSNNNRIIAVGTTSCRTLESIDLSKKKVTPISSNTDIFIYPGYKFKLVDGIITNFHLPESTLIMLVSAIAGRENILNAYQQAIKQRYRFFSFGDCMMIV